MWRFHAKSKNSHSSVQMFDHTCSRLPMRVSLEYVVSVVCNNEASAHRRILKEIDKKSEETTRIQVFRFSYAISETKLLSKNFTSNLVIRNTHVLLLPHTRTSHIHTKMTHSLNFTKTFSWLMELSRVKSMPKRNWPRKKKLSCWASHHFTFVLVLKRLLHRYIIRVFHPHPSPLPPPINTQNNTLVAVF